MIITPDFTTTDLIKGDVLRGNIYYDSKINTLILDNVTITEHVTFLEVGTITLIGENTIMGITSTEYLSIKGKGELLLTGYIKIDKLLVEGCTLHINNPSYDPSYCIGGIGQLAVKNANMVLSKLCTLRLTKNNIKLQGCSIVQDSPYLIIIQKDRKT